MLRSMYSGISGMKVNQTKLDVTGNNIANVGTTGFKTSRVRFQDMLSQNVTEALGPGKNQGGVNPRQVGLGVQLAGIDTIVTQGMMQPTSRPLDVAMDGEGYFIVGKGEIPASNYAGVLVDSREHGITNSNGMEINYTRDGALTLDYQGNLLTSDGYRVLGYDLSEMKDQYGRISDVKSIDYASNGVVNFVDVDAKYGLKASDTLVPLRIPNVVHVAAFKNEKAADGTEITSEFNYTGTGKILNDDGTSVVDPIPNILITTPTPNGVYTGTTDLQIQVKWVDSPKTQEDGTDWGTTAIEGGYRVFINGNEFKGLDGDFTINVDSNGKIDKLDDDYDGTAVTTLTLDGLPTGMEDVDRPKYSWDFNITAERDKKVRSFSIEKDGVIKAVLDDGSVSALGQIAVSSFKNPGGLSKLGRNLYQNTSNSGEAILKSGAGAAAANDNTDGFGDMLQGNLEMSNVDLAEQFTDMIVTTRAFQAAGKMISTGDEILQDIINLKR